MRCLAKITIRISVHERTLLRLHKTTDLKRQSISTSRLILSGLEKEISQRQASASMDKSTFLLAKKTVVRATLYGKQRAVVPVLPSLSLSSVSLLHAQTKPVD